MTLKEKFYKESIEKPYIFPLDEYKQIAEDFAIGFAEWLFNIDKEALKKQLNHFKEEKGL